MSEGARVQPEFLVRDDGAVFLDLAAVRAQLEALDDEGRVAYRDGNASAVAQIGAERVLVVAGPGSGKSYLFLSRIEHWMQGLGNRRIYVSTFVRKLVVDLRGDVQRRLTDEQQRQVDVSTLHTLARSLLERAGGTYDLKLTRHVRIVDGFWAPVLWDDVLTFHPDLEGDSPGLGQLEDQLYDESVLVDDPWPAVWSTYRLLTKYFNAVGFAHLIHLAGTAVQEQPELVDHSFWVIDEYQDFNTSEDRLIGELTRVSDGVLLAGDDEQALYQTLKGSSPDIIIGHYSDMSFAKAMLPFCSRCSYHICNAASAFMAHHRGAGAIDKIYLPLRVEPDARRVQVIGAATPVGVIDYIRTFLADNDTEYQSYLERRAAGQDSDPFLLILSPTGGMTRAKNTGADADLQALVDEHAGDADTRSSDYLRVATYFAGVSDGGNFAVRRVLHFEDLTTDEIHGLIVESMKRGVDLQTIVAESHPAIVERMRAVYELVRAFGTDPDSIAQQLVDLLGLADAVRLRDELRARPLDAGEVEREDEEAVETAGEIAPVAKMSMVGSKGLSAHHVMIVGCDDVNMQPVSPLAFFVALTRARLTLHVLPSRGNGGSDRPHQFVLDLPENSCDYGSYRKADGHVEELDSRTALLAKFSSWERGQAYGRSRDRR